MTEDALLYWTAFAVVALGIAWGTRLYWRTLRWSERGARVAEEQRARVLEDFYWERHRRGDSQLALRLRVRADGGELAGAVSHAAQIRADRDPVTLTGVEPGYSVKVPEVLRIIAAEGAPA